MKLPLSLFRNTARILLAALLLQVAMPVLSAVKLSPANAWMEICSTTGNKWVQTHDSVHQSLPAVHAGVDHCVFCGSTGAGNVFDASLYISELTSFPQPVLQPERDPVLQYAGHTILSRAPPLYLI